MPNRAPYGAIATVTYTTSQLLPGDVIVERFDGESELSIVRRVDMPAAPAVVAKLTVDRCIHRADERTATWTYNDKRFAGIDARFNVIGNPR